MMVKKEEIEAAKLFNFLFTLHIICDGDLPPLFLGFGQNQECKDER